jgi:hypothetical protein
MDSQNSLDIQVSGYPSIRIPHPYLKLMKYLEVIKGNFHVILIEYFLCKTTIVKKYKKSLPVTVKQLLHS